MTRRRTIAPCSRALSSKSACSSNRPSTPSQVHPPGKSVADMDSLNQSAADLPMQKLAPMGSSPELLRSPPVPIVSCGKACSPAQGLTDGHVAELGYELVL